MLVAGWSRERADDSGDGGHAAGRIVLGADGPTVLHEVLVIRAGT